MTNDYTAKS